MTLHEAGDTIIGDVHIVSPSRLCADIFLIGGLSERTLYKWYLTLFYLSN